MIRVSFPIFNLALIKTNTFQYAQVSLTFFYYMFSLTAVAILRLTQYATDVFLQHNFLILFII